MNVIYPAIRSAVYPAVRGALDISEKKQTSEQTPEQIIQSLFDQGQQGFWFPFMDFASLSQDSAGTLPYTALEQPVGRVLDRSGRDNHASQVTSTARPKITQAVGQPKFLTFDGVDDRLQATLPAITGTWIVGYKEGTLVYKVAIPAGAFPIGTNTNAVFYTPSKNFVGMVLRAGDLTDVEVSVVESYLVANGAGAVGVDAFAGVSNFFAAWYNCSSLTSFPLINTAAGTNFVNAWEGCTSLTSFPLINTAAGTNFNYAWKGCTSLTSFPLINTAAGTDFNSTWFGCSSLTSFPLINTAAGTDFIYTWYNCSSLTSFPLINTAAGTNFQSAWYGCASLTSFPLINTAAGTYFSHAWRGCTSLTSFPLINTAAGTNFNYAWQGCTSLSSFPSNMFDSCTSTSFNGAFQNCALSQASVDGILASLVTAGNSNGTLNMHGGTSATPSAAGLASKATLVSRGWTVTHN